MNKPLVPRALPPTLQQMKNRLAGHAADVRQSVAGVRHHFDGEGKLCAVLDRSSSMSGEPIIEARRGLLDTARQCSAKGYRIGLVAFESSAALVRPLGRFDDSFERDLNGIHPDGGTDIADGIRCGHEALGRGGRRVILLVTDGFSDPERAFAAADRAKSDGVQIWTIGTSGADHELLQKLASPRTVVAVVPTGDLGKAIAQTSRLLLGGPATKPMR